MTEVERWRAERTTQDRALEFVTATLHELGLHPQRSTLDVLAAHVTRALLDNLPEPDSETTSPGR